MVRTERANPDQLIEIWKKAEKGTGGLPKLTYLEFKLMPLYRVGEALDIVNGAVIIAREGIDESYVAMTLQRYFSLVPINPNPKRVPRMLRHEGILYREII